MHAIGIWQNVACMHANEFKLLELHQSATTQTNIQCFWVVSWAFEYRLFLLNIVCLRNRL